MCLPPCHPSQFQLGRRHWPPFHRIPPCAAAREFAPNATREPARRRTACHRERLALFDLRKLSPVEQNVGIVAFIDRSEDEIEAEINGDGEPGTAELVVAKHRYGPTRDITLTFNPEYARFDNRNDASHM